MCLYSRPQIAGSIRAELFKGTGHGLRASDIGRNVRRLLEISRNREESKRWDRKTSGDAKGQVQLAVRRGLSRKRVSRDWKEKIRDLHIYSTTKIPSDRWKTS